MARSKRDAEEKERPAIGLAIWWIDARSVSGWQSCSDIETFIKDNDSRRMLSYGHFFYCDRDRLVIVQNRDFKGRKDALYGEVLEIPRKMIQDVRRINFGAKPINLDGLIETQPRV